MTADAMIMQRTNKPVITYEVYDDQGRSVGCVILPKSTRIVGQSEGTVLLRRPSSTGRERTAARPPAPVRKAS